MNPLRASLPAVIALVAAAAALEAQTISNVDFDAIRRAISDTASAYHYPALWRRLMRDDPALGRREYAHLYYGQVYQDSYDPVNARLREREREARAHLRAGRRRTAAAAAQELARIEPLNLQHIDLAGASLLAAGDTAAAKRYARRWRHLTELILASGDGRTDTTAYVTVRVPDEYQAMRRLGVEPADHFFRGSRQGRFFSDVFSLKSNPGGRDSVYFNTNWSYWFLQRSVEPDRKGYR